MAARVTDFDYELPEALIAQRPPEVRDGARLLLLERDCGRVSHRQVAELPEILGVEHRVDPTLMVVNNSRVLPARLAARRESGGRVEVLLVEPLEDDDDARLARGEPVARWRAMLRASKRLRAGELLSLDDGSAVELLEAPSGGRAPVRLADPGAVARLGAMPLPPYIARAAEAEDGERYQTVYAEPLGSVAAPTAGLHLSEPLLEGLAGAGVERAEVTLHVGPGTFTPVRAERVADHRMESERFVVPERTAQRIAQTRAAGGRVLAVGTTSVRTLEGSGGHAGAARTELFITPGYSFAVVDALLTNFHLPRSTLLMLVSAFAGRERVLAAYAEAVRERYRFYSYGDAMLIV